MQAQVLVACKVGAAHSLLVFISYVHSHCNCCGVAVVVVAAVAAVAIAAAGLVASF